MGYPTPDIIPPIEEATYRGVCVYVPDKPEYLQALLGSLSGLSQWIVWERDDDKSAKKSADLWKVANALTTLTWEKDCGGCGEMAFDCEAMKECLIEVAKAISVNVTVNNSCGASGSDAFYCVSDDGTTIINPPPVGDTPPPPPTLPPDIDPVPVVTPDEGDPPEGWETWEAYDASACNAANAYVDFVARALRWIASFIESDLIQISVLVVSLFALLGGGLVGLFSRSTMILIAEMVYQLLALEWLTDEIDDMAQWVEDNRQELVCGLYRKRGNINEATTDFIADLYGEAVALVTDIEDSGTWLSYWYKLANMFFGGELLHYFMRLESPVNPNFVNCSLCDESPPVFWVADYSSGYNGTSTYTNDINLFNRIKFACSLYKSSQYSGTQIRHLLNVEGMASGAAVNYTFINASTTIKNWQLSFYDTQNGTGTILQEVPLSTSGSFVLTGNHGSVRLTHDGTLYTLPNPFNFDIDLFLDWVQP